MLSRYGISIGGGTNEVQRNNLAERALGLPKEPTVPRDTPWSSSSAASPPFWRRYRVICDGVAAPKREGSGGGELGAEPGADHLVGERGGGEVEVDEAVGLARVTDLFDVDAVFAQTVGVRATFVAQQVAPAEDHDRGRQVAQVLRVQRRRVRVVVEVASRRCRRPST